MKKRNRLILSIIVIGLLSIVGCSQKESSLKPNKKNEVLKEQQVSDIAVEVKPIVDKKLEVVTKVKPKVAIVEVDKLNKDEVPVVVVDPIEEKAPIKEVEILPVVDDTVGVVTKVEPTLEVVEEIPVKDDNATVVIEPIVE